MSRPRQFKRELSYIKPLTFLIAESNSTGRTTFLREIYKTPKDTFKKEIILPEVYIREEISGITPQEFNKITQDKLKKFGQETGLFGTIKFSDILEEKLRLSVELTVQYLILPLLKNGIFVYQNPDNRIHPKVAAELTSFLIQRIKEGNSFFIKTHSEDMLKRARIEIMEGKINHNDVTFLYFVKTSTKKRKIYPITFDKEGNMLNVPTEYKKWQIEENKKCTKH